MKLYFSCQQNLVLTRNNINNKQHGIGLIELLVSMFIGLFIMAGVVQMVGTTSQNAVNTNGISRIQENTRYAFSRMEDDLMRAGNMGCVSGSVAYESISTNSSHVGQDPRSLTDVNRMVDSLLTANTARNQRYDYNNLIGGFDIVGSTNNTDPAANGDTALGIADTDTFVVRIVDQGSRLLAASAPDQAGSLQVANASALASENIKPYQVVTIANCERSVTLMVASASGAIVTWNTDTAPSSGINAGQANSTTETNFTNDSSVIASPIYLYAGETGAYRYYISTSKFGTDSNETCNTSTKKQYCALFRVSDGAGEELVDGVHNMQVTYGITTQNAAGDDEFIYQTATDINKLGGVAADTAWNSVDRVRIELSVNSIDNLVTQGNGTGAKALEETFTRTITLFNQL